MPEQTPPDPQHIYRQGDEIISALKHRRNPRVFIVSGPSGVGKDAVLEELKLRYPKATYIVTATTREKREGEQHGVHYLFLTEEEFLQRIDANDFLEHAIVYGNHYGVPKWTVLEGLKQGRDVVIKVDVQGHAFLRTLMTDTVSIFLAPESTECLHQFLLNRKTETPEKLLERLATSVEELHRVDEFDYLVFNLPDQLDSTINQICDIIETVNRQVDQPEVTFR